MPLKWIVLGVTLLAFGAGALWVNGARTYDGLDFGAVSAQPEGGKDVGDSFGGAITVVPLRSRAVMDYAVSVRNAGGRTVEITGVGDRPEEFKGREDYQLTPVRVRMMPGEGFDPEALVPFEPVELAPGTEKTFVISQRMPLCRHFSPGGGTGVPNFDVRFKALVFDREQTIPLRMPIEVRAGDECEKA